MLTDSPSHYAAVREATSRAQRLGRPVLASWTAPSSLEPISFFARAANAADRALWMRPTSGDALVGIGAASTLTGHGANRFRHIREQWRELLAEAVSDDPPEQAFGGPLLLGGFSFDPTRRRSSDLWTGFPDARLVLPDRMLVVREGRAWLTHNVVVRPHAASQQHTQPPTPAANGVDPTLSAEQWQTLVGSIGRGIRTGQLGVQKVVLARAEQIQQARPIDSQLVVRNLAESYPACTVFAVARGDACFVGATPERLIALRDGTASTLALAGSFPRGATPDEDQRAAERLLQDPKERAEHAIVVAAVREALAQVCTRVISDTQPRLKQLSNVQHLLTPIRAAVAAGVGILDLVERLHPTPAVGGFPTHRALELIREREALDRGWYAGPIGWMNRAGEGEFVVGIRSALLNGSSATLFAGCGIVGESDPAREYAESGWKLQPMRAALGLKT
ncbi:MAG: isochorismate synthase [Chloroflexota bacterium]|nr:isochorismate synthase [Chloroflexota bacterium]